MELKNETKVGLSGEVSIIPVWAWILAVIGFAVMQVVCNVVLARQHDAPPPVVRALLGLLAGAVAVCYLLLIAYITRDARRRGMSPVLWTFVAILVPNALGIILYFILRQPIRSACPQCGSFVQSGFNFCPHCSHKLSPSCPKCQHMVTATDVYCPYCGTPLTAAVTPGAG
jgi:RNA polymerase subunit RPABC4/transcription elongation factor Spt4